MYTEPDSLYAVAMAKRVMMGVQEFRLKLKERIDAGVKGQEHTIISQRGNVVMAAVPIDWYRRAADAVGEPTEY